MCKFVNRKVKEELVKCARRKAKDIDELRGKVFVNEDLTDVRQKMCGLARKCDKVKNVVTSNGSVLCYLKQVRMDGRNVLKKVDQPEDLAEVIGMPVSEVLKKIGIVGE